MKQMLMYKRRVRLHRSLVKSAQMKACLMKYEAQMISCQLLPDEPTVLVYCAQQRNEGACTQ